MKRNIPALAKEFDAKVKEIKKFIDSAFKICLDLEPFPLINGLKREDKNDLKNDLTKSIFNKDVDNFSFEKLEIIFHDFILD